MRHLLSALLLAPLLCAAQTPTWEWVKAQAGTPFEIVALPTGGGFFFGNTESADGFFNVMVPPDGNFMARFDSNGNVLWTQSMGTCYVQRAKHHDNGIHLTALCYGSELNWGGMTAQLNVNSYNIVTARLNQNGSGEWVRNIESAVSLPIGFDVNPEGESFIGLTM